MQFVCATHATIFIESCCVELYFVIGESNCLPCQCFIVSNLLLWHEHSSVNNMYMNDLKVRDLKHEYDNSFVPTQEYLDSMPDLQNSDFVGIPIDFVGIHGMHLPLKIREKNGDTQEVMAEVIPWASR